MTDSANPSQLFWPADLIEQATGIIMNRLELDAAHAFKVLRKMSQNTRTQMCVVAEQIINHNVPVEAMRGLEKDVLGFATVSRKLRIVEPSEPAKKLRGPAD